MSRVPLSDADARPWHSDRCYRESTRIDGAPCICGLAALRKDALAGMRLRVELEAARDLARDIQRFERSGSASVLNHDPKDRAWYAEKRGDADHHEVLEKMIDELVSLSADCPALTEAESMCRCCIGGKHDVCCPGWFVNEETGLVERCDECGVFGDDEAAAAAAGIGE